MWNEAKTHSHCIASHRKFIWKVNVGREKKREYNQITTHNNGKYNFSLPFPNFGCKSIAYLKSIWRVVLRTIFLSKNFRNYWCNSFSISLHFIFFIQIEFIYLWNPFDFRRFYRLRMYIFSVRNSCSRNLVATRWRYRRDVGKDYFTLFLPHIVSDNNSSSHLICKFRFLFSLQLFGLRQFDWHLPDRVKIGKCHEFRCTIHQSWCSHWCRWS